MNLQVNCLFPKLNVRSHWPIGPKLAPLAHVTLGIYTFSNWGVCGNDLRNLSEITEIFAPLSHRADATMFWTITCKVALFLWRDALLMATVSGSSQCDIGGIHLLNWLNSSIKSYSAATLWDESWVNWPFSHVITACTTSFTDFPDEGALSC